MNTLAAIDIGSNTVQLLIAKTDHGQVISRGNHILTTRLGAADQEKHLSSAAIAATTAAVAKFMDLAKQSGAEQIRIIATSAVRDAANQQDLLNEIKSITPQQVEIISGQEEALMSYQGARSLLAFVPGTPVLDVGGSSTELIYGFSAGDIRCTSVNIGSVRMKQHNWSDDEMRTILGNGFVRQGDADIAVGIGGTITATAGVLAGLDSYDREAIEGVTLEKKQLSDLLAQLLPLSIAQRCSYSPLLSKRGEIIEQGLRIWLGLSDLLGFNKILVCGGGILDGAIATMI